jgi:hypothetical protein
MPNNAKVGGVLSIVAGSLGLCGFLLYVFFVAIIAWGFGDFSFTYKSGTEEEYIAIFFLVFYGVMGLLYALVSVLAIVGGALALRKRNWGWALAGSIGATMSFFPCGIPAIIFISMGKPEFRAPGPSAPPAPAAPITG